MSLGDSSCTLKRLVPQTPGSFCPMAFRDCGRWLGIWRQGASTDNLASQRKILIQSEVETDKKKKQTNKLKLSQLIVAQIPKCYKLPSSISSAWKPVH